MIDLTVEMVSERREFVPEPSNSSRLVVPGDPGGILSEAASSTVTSQPTGTEGTQLPANGFPATMLDQIVVKLQRSVERYPTSAHAWANLGVALLNAGACDDAEQAFRKALEFDPHNFVAAEGLGRVQLVRLSHGDTQAADTARAAYDRLYHLYPRSMEASLGRAKLAFQREERANAYEHWREAIKVASASPLPRVYFAVVLIAVEDYREAVAQLKRASRLGPPNALVYHNLAVAYLSMNNRSKGRKYLQMALTLAPEMQETVLAWAHLLMTDKRFQESKAVLTRHISRTRHNPQAHELLAQVYINQKEYKRAKSELFSASQDTQLQGTPRDRGRLANNLGVCYWLLGDYVEASKMFDASIRTCPAEDRTPYHNLARLHLALRETAEARAVIDRCLQAYPDDAGTQLLLAVSLEAQGQYGEALSELRNLIGSGGNQAPLEAYGMLGALLTDFEHDPAAGITVLRDALARFPGNPLLSNNLAYAYLVQGNLGAARDTLNAIAEPIEGIAEVVIPATRGLLSLLEGDFAQGGDGYHQAEQIARRQGKDPWVPLIQQKRHLEFARAYLSSGDLRQAQKEVRAGLSRDGSKLNRRELLKLQQTMEPNAGA